MESNQNGKSNSSVISQEDWMLLQQLLNEDEEAEITGQCSRAQNKHNFIHCPDCHVGLTMHCTLNGCPCGGSAFMIPSNIHYKFAHQHPAHTRSVKIDIRRPAQAIDRIQRVFQVENELAALRENNSQ